MAAAFFGAAFLAAAFFGAAFLAAAFFGAAFLAAAFFGAAFLAAGLFAGAAGIAGMPEDMGSVCAIFGSLGPLRAGLEVELGDVALSVGNFVDCAPFSLIFISDSFFAAATETSAAFAFGFDGFFVGSMPARICASRLPG